MCGPPLFLLVELVNRRQEYWVEAFRMLTILVEKRPTVKGT